MNCVLYPRNPRPAKKSLDRRAGGLTAEYDRKARECNTEYCGTEPGHGEWVEVSKEVHELIHQLANARLLLAGLVKPL